MELEPLEKAVLEKLLAGDNVVLGALRNQLVGITVENREYSGCGFFTYFRLLSMAVSAPVASDKIIAGDVGAEISNMKYGAGFVLYIEGGFIRELEGFCYDELWPERVGDFSLMYADSSRHEFMRRVVG